MIGSLDIDALRAFVAIVDRMSFSRAGEAIGRSQSAVSLRLRQLERSLGISLLVRRQGRVIELTEGGRTLLGFARSIVDINDAALRELSAKPAGARVRLGVPADFLDAAFTGTLARTRALFPELRLEIETDVSDRLRSRCLAGELDAAFYKLVVPDGVGTLVKKMALQWVADPGFALARDGIIPLICFPEGCAYRERMVQVLTNAGLEHQIVVTTPSLQSLRHAVSARLGVTALPVTGGELVAVPGLPDPGGVAVAMAIAPGDKPQIRRVAGSLANALFPRGNPEMAGRRRPVNAMTAGRAA